MDPRVKRNSLLIFLGILILGIVFSWWTTHDPSYLRSARVVGIAPRGLRVEIINQPNQPEVSEIVFVSVPRETYGHSQIYTGDIISVVLHDSGYATLRKRPE